MRRRGDRAVHTVLPAVKADTGQLGVYDDHNGGKSVTAKGRPVTAVRTPQTDVIWPQLVRPREGEVLKPKHKHQRLKDRSMIKEERSRGQGTSIQDPGKKKMTQ